MNCIFCFIILFLINIQRIFSSFAKQILFALALLQICNIKNNLCVKKSFVIFEKLLNAFFLPQGTQRFFTRFTSVGF